MSLLSPQLDAFVAIAKYKTVHAAAKAIHLTQTAVTQRIRTLESRLHTTLFLRSRRGMLLTPEGEALLHYCQAAQDLEGATLAKIKGAASQTQIQFGITGPTSIMHARIIPQCLPVMKAFPNLLMHFDISDIKHRDRHLRTGLYQLAIIQKEVVTAEMEHKILRPERYVLVCSSAWQKRKLTDIIRNERIIDFNPNDQMTLNYLKHFDLFNNTVRVERHFANRTEALAMLLTAGFGYGVLTTEFSQPYIAAKQLIVLNHGKIYENSLALAWFARPEPPAYFSALLAAIQ